MPLRWNEGSYDHQFRAPDLDWAMFKQGENQCMLLFCDVSSYCLCPFFALAVYFLYGGLSRANVSDATKDFVFPHLHAMRRENVARRLTTSIRSHVDTGHMDDEAAKKRKKAFTSRSTRKGVMTENRINRDLSTQEEYSRSGHAMSDVHNSSAEGYVESTPALNAPAGCAYAGHKDCHVQPQPVSFDCLLHVGPAVDRLVQHMFVNDVPELKKNGKLVMVLDTCAARLVGSYNKLVTDVGRDNGILMKLQLAASKAAIDDPKVPPQPCSKVERGPEALVDHHHA